MKKNFKKALGYLIIFTFLISVFLSSPLPAHATVCYDSQKYIISVPSCWLNQLPAEIEQTDPNPRAYHATASAASDGGIDLTWTLSTSVYLTQSPPYIQMDRINRFYFGSIHNGAFHRIGGDWNIVDSNQSNPLKEFSITSGNPQQPGFQTIQYKIHFSKTLADAQDKDVIFLIIPADTGGGKLERLSRPTLVPYQLSDQMTIRTYADVWPRDQVDSMSTFAGAPLNATCRQNQNSLTQSAVKIRNSLLDLIQLLGGITEMVDMTALAAPQQDNLLKEGLKAILYDPIVSYLNNNPDKVAVVQPLLNEAQNQSDQIFNDLVTYRTNLAQALEAAQTVTPKLTAEDIMKKIEEAKDMSSPGGINDIVKNQLGISDDCLLQFAGNYYRLSIEYKFNAAAIAANQGQTTGAAGADTCGIGGLFGGIMCTALGFLAQAAANVGVWAIQFLLQAVGIQ